MEYGSPKPAFQEGITADDFKVYEEEWDWLVRRAARNRPINIRLFRKAFPEFEWVTVKENTGDLIRELKSESTFYALESAIDVISDGLSPDNALQKAEQLREILGGIMRSQGGHSDLFLKRDFHDHIRRIEEARILREQGIPPGIPTGFRSLDHHLGGMVSGRGILFLGRPGDAKSMTIAKCFVSGFLDGKRMGLFSPEMDEDEHRARVATLISADPKIQAMLGLKHSFRNRALMEGRGFNIKTYKRFWEFLESEMTGEMVLFTQKYRGEKLTAAFIDSRVDDLALDCIFVDPIYKLKSPSKRQLRYEELQEIVDSLMDIGHNHHVPVVMSNQAKRADSMRGSNRTPDKDSSFGADAPVQEADHVIGVRHFSDEKKLVMKCSKNRFGEEFRVDVSFWPNTGRMEDVSNISHSYLNGHDAAKVEAELKKAIKNIDKPVAKAKARDKVDAT